MKKITKKQIKEKLEEVMDPELNISIIDLGLVYDISIKENNKKPPLVKIVMTLTTIGCPLITIIEEEIKNKLNELSIPSDKIIVELTFDPPWSMEKMSPKAKALLGI
ncbi:MAG: metal-sulfur cluster assembly factor [Microgenomates group bacterium]